MKKILGLDLGTNSIGWALVEQNFENKEGKINGIGSRIIPMTKDVMDNFGSGVSISQTSERTGYRGVRRLRQRVLLRRERLHRVLNILDFLPSHYAQAIDFEKRLGQFKEEQEVKLNYFKNENGRHEFLFQESFLEMVKEFKANGHNGRMPYDWTLYFLRKKALTHKISKEELAWVILNFNQKRGYYQLRGEDDNGDASKSEEFYTLKIIDVIPTEDRNAKGIWYNVNLENGWIYRRQSKESLINWIGKNKEFIVTTQLDSDGNPKSDKEGVVKRSFRSVDSEKDWIAIKKKTEQDIEKSEKTIGQYIYETLLQNPKQKINGKLVRTIERNYYKDELKAILKKQIEEHSELQNGKLYNASIEELYPRNEAHQNNIKDKDFAYLFIDDIIFYQRPLKSKKSTISGCNYEKRTFKKTIKVLENEQKIEKAISVNEPIKTISKSHPLYQEFRLWQFLRNLRIFQKEGEIDGKSRIDIDVTAQILETEDDWIDLYEFLNIRKEIEQKQIIQYFISTKKIPKANKANYRWNYVEDKKYPCNETKAQILSRLNKVAQVDATDFLTSEVEQRLWHIIYSVKDKNDFEKALGSFAQKQGIHEISFVENFKKFPPFKNEYGAYCEKAIKKILPLMRIGKYWDENAIPQIVKDRVSAIIARLEHINFDINKIDENIVDDDIPQQLLKSFIDFKDKNPLQGLNTYQACYLVYDRHSEATDISKWKTPKDIDIFLDEFKQHRLRNPIVEQVVTETLRVVRDIWTYYGQNTENFFDEIHVELGRDMKNPASKREQLTKHISENENTNFRIKEILKELTDDPNIEGDIRPYSPSHQEILKIYEEGIYQSSDKVDDDIDKIRKNSTPSKNDITKYKLWLEQGYISPYTGQTIPLSRLFTTDYQIEHIIPQSRYFDNSLSNKVICESAINPNPYKDNQTGYEFIKNNEELIVPELSTSHKTVKLFNLKEYETHCNYYFKKNRGKLKHLLSEDIPEGFINRQMNDSRYISKFIKGLLSNIVREENEQEATSKNVIPVVGAITSKLKQDWGLNDKWNEIIAYRFKRLNKITQTKEYGHWDQKLNTFRTLVPDSISKGFNKKRIDHRHHALDALVVACTSRKHTQYLNALNAQKGNYGLKETLLVKNKHGDYTKHFLTPWNNFTIDTKSALERIVVSFKQNLRVINKTNNKTWQWANNNGKLKKELVKQTKGENWAIRKPLHKETVYGKVTVKQKRKSPVSLNKILENYELIVDKKIKSLIREKVVFYNKDLKRLKKYFKDNPITIDGQQINKLEIFEFVEATASRVALSDKFTRKQLESITDSGIHMIMENHLLNYIEDDKERFDLAFNSDGIDELNKNIVKLNNGKLHQPIYKVRLYEEGNRFNVGDTGNKTDKYVEAAKGTNLFFAIYWDAEKQRRVFETIPLNEIIEHQKQVAHLPKEERTPVPVDKTKGEFLFSLSPNDLVYVPTDEERDNPILVDFNNLTNALAGRVYKMVSSTGSECHFVQNQIASLIKSYDAKSKTGEFGSLNKMETTIEDIRIKEKCWKLTVDRLGNVKSVIKSS